MNIKIMKHFARSKQRAALKKLFSLPPHLIPSQIKPYYVSGTKIFLRRYKEIYRHLLSKCSSWASRNGAVQIFFSDTKKKHVC